MYELMTYWMAIAQTAVIFAVLPFAVHRMKKRSRLAKRCAAMYDRCIAIVDEIKEFERDRSAYIDELYLDFKAIGCWDEDPRKRLALYTAFADKWEAKIADGEILRTWETEKEEG